MKGMGCQIDLCFGDHMNCSTVEPPNNGHIGRRTFVRYWEVSLSRRAYCHFEHCFQGRTQHLYVGGSD